ncbi:MAG TPA: hypothetical protein VJ743_01695 [Albitalea sp.]|nr:hypothetical protein [Albitalea sp.]
MDPTGRLAARCYGLDGHRVEIEPEDRSRFNDTLALIPKATNDEDGVTHQRGAVEVGGRENLPRIAMNRNEPIAIDDHDIVADVVVGVVVVLVLACDMHGS